jgi:hypothetical protein
MLVQVEPDALGFVAHARNPTSASVIPKQNEAAGERRTAVGRDRDCPERGYQNAISHFVLQHDFEAGTTLVTILPLIARLPNLDRKMLLAFSRELFGKSLLPEAMRSELASRICYRASVRQPAVS